ncbi:MAG TPA: DUF2793 domain-containing protein [Pyrinomonadaceae bacterium]|nr:DUF2793 domain-containing protein [Pyrinomonadaceae bacterium]
MANDNTTTNNMNELCKLAAFDRNRYFAGKLMTARDFNQEQEYLNGKRWLINRLLFGSGIACGLEVTTSSSPRVVTLKPGVAIDACGHEIVVPLEAKLDLDTMEIEPPVSPATTKTVRLCLRYTECWQEPIPSMKNSACDEVCNFNRTREAYIFKILPPRPQPPASDPTFCEQWMSERVYVGQNANLRVERLAPLWVRENSTFEVAVKVTALTDNVSNVQVTDTFTNATLVEPQPTPPSQFPTPPATLRQGEFFIYVYQLKAPAAASSGPTLKISINSTLPIAGQPPTTQIEVLTEADAKLREAGQRLKDCADEPTEEEKCVDIAELTLNFASGKLNSVGSINLTRTRRFKYTLERTAEILECIRASMLAEEGTERPGHFFITFKDLEVNSLQPIGPANQHGTTFDVPRGNHVHALLFDTNPGLQFNGNRLFINGDVGGAAIRFLNTVSGRDPVQPVHLTTKAYVDAAIDSKIAGLDWQESVKDKDLAAPPASPATDDRYLILPAGAGAWAGKTNSIAEWNGTAWDFTAPDEGTAVFVEDENMAYLFVDGGWIQFLATPTVAAGNGLEASGAILSVGKGDGIVVGPDKVSVDYSATVPTPVGMPPTAGTSNQLSRGDHSHELPLAANSGLEFLTNKLRINGNVGGNTIKFLNPVSGQSPVLAEHLVTKSYVDAKVSGLDWQESVLDKDLTTPPNAPPIGARYLLFEAALLGTWAGKTKSIAEWNGAAWEFTQADEGTALFVEDEKLAYLFTGGNWSAFLAMPDVAAGNGLVASGATISVGKGVGVIVDASNVSVEFDTTVPPAVGPAGSAGNSNKAAQGNHTHALPLETDGGLKFNGPNLRIDGNIKGTNIRFLENVSGKDPVTETHLVTKLYVDSLVDAKMAGLDWQESVLDKDLTSPPAPNAGLRYLLTFTNLSGAWSGHQNEIAVGTGTAWKFITPDAGTAVFVEDEKTAYIFVDGAWTKFLAGQSDSTDSTTGTVIFNTPQGFNAPVISGDITPNLGQGLISLILSLEKDPTEKNPSTIFIGDPESANAAGYNNVYLAAQITLGAAATRRSTTFRVLARPGNLVESREMKGFRVRWYAYKVGADQGATTVEGFRIK